MICRDEEDSLHPRLLLLFLLLCPEFPALFGRHLNGVAALLGLFIDFLFQRVKQSSIVDLLVPLIFPA